jgi:NAD(P)-dependent dehydrogenase (short-subunit alcohol dehydrogenase family)
MVYHEGLVALVSGATRGIGREVARQLAGRGVAVAVGCRDLAAGRAVAGGLPAASPVPLDVTVPGGATAAVAAVRDRFGRLDILVNNAGRIVEATAPDTTAAVLREVFDVNVFGVADLTGAALPLLRHSPAARIVNVSSTTGSLALTAAGTDFGGDADRRTAYAASKSALNMLTIQYDRAFQADPALRHIKVNSATPGYTATGMNGGRGTRTVTQGAAVIVRLALAPADGPSGGFSNDAGPVPW